MPYAIPLASFILIVPCRPGYITKEDRSQSEQAEMAHLLFLLKELPRGACIVLGMTFCLTIVRSQATSDGTSLEKVRCLHRSRFNLRQIRTADSTRYPYYDNATTKNVTTTSGKTTYLPCRVRFLGDRTVSWIRRKDLHVLTVAKFSYTNDQRFQVIHLDNTDDWTLQIKYAQRNDAGIYECQLSTVPKMSHFVTLNVIVSKATIVGRPALYINSGSTLNLTCVVMESPVPPDYVFWYHNGEVINYDSPRGISVHTEKALRTTSRLLIRNAQPMDSGNYSCVPSNADPADIAVHVLNGQHPAAMQHGKHTSAATGVSFSLPQLLALLVMYFQAAGER